MQAKSSFKNGNRGRTDERFVHRLVNRLKISSSNLSSLSEIMAKPILPIASGNVHRFQAIVQTPAEKKKLRMVIDAKIKNWFAGL